MSIFQQLFGATELPSPWASHFKHRYHSQ